MPIMHQTKQGCVDVAFLVLGPIENNVYIIGDGSALLVVDPSCEFEAILQALGTAVPSAIVLTHYHYDHIGAARQLREATGAPVIASAVDAPCIDGRKEPPSSHGNPPTCPVDTELSDGDVIEIGSMAWKVILTPGHSPGSMCLFLDPSFGEYPDRAPVLISGDTLFNATIGRTDFPDGNPYDMRASLKKLAVLPDETLVLPGHGELTTIGAERRRVFALYGASS